MSISINLEPIWGTAPTVIAKFGITQGKLLELGKKGIIRARKENPNSRSSRIVFRLADVNYWLENVAPKPRAEAFEPRRGTDNSAGGAGKEGYGFCESRRQCCSTEQGISAAAT